MAAGNKSSKPAKKEKAGMLEGLWIVGKYPYVQGITCVSCIFMIEVTMLLMVLMTYPFLASFVWLRITKPDVPRAFKIPGGTVCAFFWTLPPTIIGTVYAYICIFVEVDMTYGIPYFNVLCCHNLHRLSHPGCLQELLRSLRQGEPAVRACSMVMRQYAYVHAAVLVWLVWLTRPAPAG